jgi:hypothetical protein
VESIALPGIQAQIHGEELEVALESSWHVVPVNTLAFDGPNLQFGFLQRKQEQGDLHFTFAIMLSPTIPLPSNNVTPLISVLSNSGSTCPWFPSLALIVTFPFPSAYMTNIFAPDICPPIPSPTHWYVFGADS